MLHRLVPAEHRRRPGVASTVVFREIDGQLSLELRQQGLTPEFFTRSGKTRPISAKYVEAVRLVTAGVSCINCCHCHALVEKVPASEPTVTQALITA